MLFIADLESVEMAFSAPDTNEPSLWQHLEALEKGLRQAIAEHNELWAQVGRIRADVGHIYRLIQSDTGQGDRYRFAFSPLERLSSVEGALAVLSNKIEAMKP